MGHNISNRKCTGEALRSSLEDWSGWRLGVECGTPGCTIGRAYDVAQLCRMYPGRTVFQAIQRMRCNGCGKAPGAACRWPTPGMPRRAEAIPLMGPGTV
jgi:hypothetical protein